MKAKLFGDTKTTRKILTPKTALECKRLSHDIANYNHEQWKTEARVHCEEGIKAKFMQNIGLRSFLLNTGEKRIIECCNDKLWGTGVPLYDENCLKSSNWNSQGILGEILEETRRIIHDILGSNRPNSPGMHSQPMTSTMDNCETSISSMSC